MVWLTDHVPVEFIAFPSSSAEDEPRHVGKRSSRSNLARETVAICDAGCYTAPSGSEIQIGPATREAVAGTKCYSLDTAMEFFDHTPPSPTKLEVTGETTIAALKRLYSTQGGHLACLNFASARNPGGGFLGGSEAQEESLARSSALFPCLLAAPEYYERNRACRTALYLDLAIWSPAVPFFRDDSGSLLDEPFRASVITAPAPNAGAVASNERARVDEIIPTLRRRAAFVLAIAAERGVRRLVLGAWGCGVFRNAPRVVARVFGELLCAPGKFAGVFDEVVFAIYDRSSDQAVVRIFKEALV